MIAFYWSSFSILHQLSTSTTKPSLEGAVDGMILHISSMSSLGVFHSERHDQRWLQEFGLSMLCMPGMPAYIWNHLTLYIYICMHTVIHISYMFYYTSRMTFLLFQTISKSAPQGKAWSTSRIHWSLVWWAFMDTQPGEVRWGRMEYTTVECKNIIDGILCTMKRGLLVVNGKRLK